MVMNDVTASTALEFSKGRRLLRRMLNRRARPGALAGLVVAAAVLWPGCKSSPTKYSSPRVTGTVLDAQTKQPLKGVRVNRVGASRQMDPNTPRRGGEWMEQQAPAFTGSDGKFELRSVADLSVTRNVYWYMVDVSFSQPGYELLVVTYTPAQATNTPSGEPVVKAGNIFLQPKSR